MSNSLGATHCTSKPIPAKPRLSRLLSDGRQGRAGIPIKWMVIMACDPNVALRPTPDPQPTLIGRYGTKREEVFGAKYRSRGKS